MPPSETARTSGSSVDSSTTLQVTPQSNELQKVAVAPGSGQPIPKLQVVTLQTAPAMSAPAEPMAKLVMNGRLVALNRRETVR
jgi:hypothetical protein